MIGSAAIDVAVGVVFTYFLFAILCSGIAEYISKLLNSRGKMLRGAIDKLLGAEAEKFWQHPLISQLSAAHSTGPQSVMDLIRKKRPAANTAPSYIAAATFAHAVLAVIGPPDQQDANAAAPGPGPAHAVPEGTAPNSGMEEVLRSLWPDAAGDVQSRPTTIFTACSLNSGV